MRLTLRRSCGSAGAQAHVWLKELFEIQMTAALIGVISVAALAQIFVSYCRSVLASARKVELSDRVRELAGMNGKGLAADDFDRVVQLVRLCPEHDADRMGVRAIGAYFRLLHVFDRMFGALISGLVPWTERERENCSHFAAVVLDRCISSNRSLFTQQAGDRL